MAAKKTTPKEIGEALGYIVEHMATKDDIADIRKAMATKADVRAIVHDELAPIRSELKSIRSDLDDLMGQFENVPGYQRKSTTRLSASRRSKSTSASTRKSPPNRHH